MGEVIEIGNARKNNHEKNKRTHLDAIERLCEFIQSDLDDIEDQDLMLAFAYLSANSGIDSGATRNSMVALMKAVYDETQKMLAVENV